MMQGFEPKQLTALYGAVLPISILLIENQEDRQFMADLYLQYKPLMYMIAVHYFRGNYAEVEDAVGGAVERLCKNHATLKGVACNKRAAYIVTTMRNVCLSRFRVLSRQTANLDFSAEPEALEAIPARENVQDIVFNRVFAIDLLNSFHELSERDREMIRMRHVDMLTYEEIARQAGMTEDTARVAVSRAKSRLEKAALAKKWGDDA